MTDGPELSPDTLHQRRGVRRLNRVPLVIAGMMLLGILGAITYTYQLRLAEMQRRVTEAETKPEAASPSGVFRDAPDGGLIPANTPEAAPPPSQTNVLPPEKPLPMAAEPDPNAQNWERYWQEQERLRQTRNGAMMQALHAPTTISRGTQMNAPKPASGTESTSPPVAGQLTALYAAEALRRHNAANSEAEEKDLNRAAAKQAWLGDRTPQSRDANYLPAGREAPVSPYEIKAGTVIPAIMIGGVNSDLPGQIIGQVTENVYDTATGRYILIPQGSKLVGTYDNAITTGQERVLVAWTRIIFPDASSIDLGKMPGADSAGLAGFHDQVNTHFWKMFGNALMMSVFSAGVQVSQGGQNNANGMNAQQTLAAGLGQQMGQLGQEMARRNMQIQPTLEIRPGLRFIVTVSKDIVIRPWRSKKG